jgi:hypothetical protein
MGGVAVALMLVGMAASADPGLAGAIAAQTLTVMGGAKGIYVLDGQVINNLTGNGIEGATIEVSAPLTKIFESTTTDASGFYSLTFNSGTATQILITCYASEFEPYDSMDTPLLADVGTWDIQLEPVGVAKPYTPKAMAGAKNVYIYWEPNPEPNLKGYRVYRQRTDAEGTPVQNAVIEEATTDLVPAVVTEFKDSYPGVQAGNYYRYYVTALSGGDRWSDPSDWSNVVRPEFLKLYFEDVNVPPAFEDGDGKYMMLWKHTDNAWWVRVPLYASCAFDLATVEGDGLNGLGIVAKFPNDLLFAGQGDEIRVMTTGITQGMKYSYNINAQNEIKISAADALSHNLYGAGALFDIYAKSRNITGCGALELVRETVGHVGVRLYKATDQGPRRLQESEFELINAQLCATEGCIMGDVDDNGLIEKADAVMINNIWVESVPVPSDPCYPWVADINHDFEVDAADAAMILAWIKNPDSINPEKVPAKSVAAKATSFAAYEKADDPTVSISGSTQGTPNQEVTVTVVMTTGSTDNALAGYTMTLAYPTGYTAIGMEAKELGMSFVRAEAPAGLDGFEFIAQETSDGNNAVLRIAAANAQSLGSKGDVALANLTFKLGADVNPDQAVALAITQFDANDQYGYTPRFQAPGKALIPGEPSTSDEVIVDPPLEGQPVEGAPVEGAPVEGQPAEGAPVEGAPVEGAPVEGQPAEGEPVEGQPAEGQPAEGEPAEGAPVEGAPVEGAPAEGQPAEGEPAEGAPVEGEVIEGQVAEGQVAEGAPVEGQVAEGAPVEGQPAEGQAVEGAPVEGAPAEGQAADGETVIPISAQEGEQPATSSSGCFGS